MSSRRSATTWMTLSSRCNLPVQRKRVAPSAARRKRSSICGPDDQIGDPGLVLDGDEDDAVGTARTLPDQHDPGDREPPVDRQMGEFGGSDETLAGKLGAQKGERMALQGQAEARIILDDMLAQRHLRQQRHGACFARMCRSRPPAAAKSGNGGSPSAFKAHSARRRSSPIERKASASARRSSAPRPSPLRRQQRARIRYTHARAATSRSASASANPFIWRNPRRRAQRLHLTPSPRRAGRGWGPAKREGEWQARVQACNPRSCD